MSQKQNRLVKRTLSFIMAVMMVCSVLLQDSFAVTANAAGTNAPKNSFLLEVGNRVKLSAPSGKTTWRSDNTGIATVYPDGTVVGLSEGNAIITATTKSTAFLFWGTKVTETKYYVTVFEPEVEQVQNHAYSIKKGETLALNVEGSNARWSTSDRSVVSVSSGGMATAKREGTATVTAISYKTTWKHFGWLFAIFARTERIVTNFTITVLPNGTPEPTVPPETEESLPHETEETLAPETEETTEPDSTEESTEPTKPENPSEADEYYWGISTIVDVIDAEDSPDVQTETDVLAMLMERGFTQYPVVSQFSMDGGYLGENAEINGGDSKHPRYQTFYRSGDAELWVIYVINGSISAYPAQYNLESSRPAELIISESNQITTYYHSRNIFYVTIPYEHALVVKAVDQINAATLDQLTQEGLDNL